MSNINRLLIPVDFTQADEKSIEFALMIAQKNYLLIDLIHVLHYSAISDPDLLEENQITLENFMTTNIPKNLTGDYYLKSAPSPSVAINAHASTGDYSMIIMTKKDKSLSGIFSSTTEQVLRKSKIPVMILDEKTVTNEIKSILVPTDGSLLSMAAFPAALNLADMFNTRITMLHVNEAYGLLSNHFSTKSYANVRNEVIQYLFARLREFFKTLANEFELLTDEHFRNPKIKITDQSSIPLRLKLVTGLSAHLEITKYANRSVDFIVMTTHGRSGLAQLFMGSHAEKVAQNIDIPILTIRPGSDLFTRNKSELETSMQLS